MHMALNVTAAWPEPQSSTTPLWTFCNNSAALTYPQLDNMLFTANAGMGPDSMIDQGLCGANTTHPYSRNPCIWVRIQAVA